MFRTSVRQFIQKELVPHQARWREQQRPDAEAWTAAGAAGMLLPDLPDTYGGGGRAEENVKRAVLPDQSDRGQSQDKHSSKWPKPLWMVARGEPRSHHRSNSVGTGRHIIGRITRREPSVGIRPPALR